MLMSRGPSLYVFALAFLFAASSLRALPVGPRTFCDVYPEAPACGGAVPTCMHCHSVPPEMNFYGDALLTALYEDEQYLDLESYEAHLPAALARVEADDADADGLTNLEEILLGTLPGDASSHYLEVPAPAGTNAYYDVGRYDARFAFKRVQVLYCGAPPSFEAMQSFDEAEDKLAAVKGALADCLGGAYWREEGLHRLADKRIRPLEAVGFDGLIPLADYAWDYRLFSHVLSDGRDARDLLLADYHVDSTGAVREGVIPAPSGSLLGTGGQPLVPERRAGMMTTQWFLMIHTMFSTLPRTTAAQAYRAYLGADIAKSEGILPVSGEPRDVDNKGVQQEACAVCHSTIDPLSYAFSEYEGIGELGDVYAFEYTGTYNPTRTPWGQDSVLLGEPVTDLMSWAEVAANSDMFKRNLALMLFEHALGRAPLPDEQASFRALWESLPSEGYSANKLIERIVLSDAFGVP